MTIFIMRFLPVQCEFCFYERNGAPAIVGLSATDLRADNAVKEPRAEDLQQRYKPQVPRNKKTPLAFFHGLENPEDQVIERDRAAVLGLRLSTDRFIAAAVGPGAQADSLDPRGHDGENAHPAALELDPQ